MNVDVSRWWNQLERLGAPARRSFNLDAGSAHNMSARRRAIRHITAGRAVAVDNDYAWVLVGDVAQAEFVQAVHEVWNNSQVNPMILTLSSTDFFELIDWGSVSEEVRLTLTAERFSQQLAGLCILRAPLQSTAIFERNIPQSAVSFDEEGRPWASNYDSTGHDAINQLVIDARAVGVAYPAMAEFRSHDMPIVNGRKVGRLLRSICDIPYGLVDKLATKQGRGPLPILALSTTGLQLETAGYLPTQLYGALLPELSIEKHIQDQSLVSAVDLNSISFGLGPALLRRAVLNYLGWSQHEMPTPSTPFITKF